MDIKEIRLSKGLTQKEAAEIVGLELRTYQNYESGKSKRDTFKINKIINVLSEYERYNETKGILSLEYLKEAVRSVCSKHNVNFVYLFGSYAKGYAGEKSDVDLMIDCEEDGFKFIGLYNELCEALHKELDLLEMKSVLKNSEFLKEILKSGIKIYTNNQ